MANSQRNKTFWVSTETANTALNQAGFEALTWVQVGGVGSIGETGISTNPISYNTLDTEVTDKAKGFSDAGNPDIECARDPADQGQILMRAAGQPSDTDKRAFKLIFQDGTIAYNRGLVGGPSRPGGDGEAFELEVYTLMLVQAEIVVDPPT
jgi:hypothetical protein